jgi:hypothetical protein
MPGKETDKVYTSTLKLNQDNNLSLKAQNSFVCTSYLPLSPKNLLKQIHWHLFTVKIIFLYEL